MATKKNIVAFETIKKEIKTAILEHKVKNVKIMLRCIKNDLKTDGTFDLACNGCNEQFLCGELKRRIEVSIRTAVNRIK